MHDYLASEAVSNVMPKEPFGQERKYSRNQFEHLLVYLDDGLLPIDDNETERLVKQVALGRKNWMFIGGVAAGYRVAAHRPAGLISSAPPISAPRAPWRWCALTGERRIVGLAFCGRLSAAIVVLTECRSPVRDARCHVVDPVAHSRMPTGGRGPSGGSLPRQTGNL